MRKRRLKEKLCPFCGQPAGQGRANSRIQVSSSPGPVLHLPPSPLLRGLTENSLSFVLIGGLWAYPLFGLGDALTSLLRELVVAYLAFVLIGQFSVTLQETGRIMPRMGEWDRKLWQSCGNSRERVAHPARLGWMQTGQWSGALCLASFCPSTSWPCLARPRTGGCWVQERGWEGPLNLVLKEFFKA